MRFRGLHVFALTAALMTFSGFVARAGAQSGVREVSATERGVIPLQTRLRYTTMVILPDGESAPDLPIFLEGMTWVDFRKQKPDPLQRLLWGITGRREVGEGIPRR